MIRRFWKRSPALTLAFLLAIAACLFFTGRTALYSANLYWRSERPVAGWMTPRYIALAYGVDRDTLATLLSTDDRDDLRQPLYAIARDNGVPVTAVIGSVQALIDAKDSAE